MMEQTRRLLCTLLLLLLPVLVQSSDANQMEDGSTLKVAFQRQAVADRRERGEDCGERRKAVVVWTAPTNSCADCNCYLEYTVEDTKAEAGAYFDTDDWLSWTWSGDSELQTQGNTDSYVCRPVYGRKQSSIKQNRVAAFDAHSIERLTCTSPSLPSLRPLEFAPCGVLLTESAWMTMTIINRAYTQSALRLTVLLRVGNAQTQTQAAAAEADALEVEFEVEHVRLQLRRASDAPFLFEPQSAVRHNASDALLTFDIPNSLHQRLGERAAATAYAISGCRNYTVNKTTFELQLPLQASDSPTPTVTATVTVTSTLLLFLSDSALHVARMTDQLVSLVQVGRLNLTGRRSGFRLVDVHALHSEELVFVSDNGGRLYKVRVRVRVRVRVTSAGEEEELALLQYRDLSESCTADYRIGVDWLRKEVYAVGCRQLWLCSVELHCSKVHAFDTAPDRILLDPINGFIFYSAEGKLHMLNWNASSRSVISDVQLTSVDKVVAFHLLPLSSVLQYSDGVALRQVDIWTGKRTDMHIDGLSGCIDDFIVHNSSHISILCNGTMQLQLRTGLATSTPSFIIRAFALYSNTVQPEPELEISRVVFLISSVYLNWSYAQSGAAARFGALRWLPNVFELRIELCDVEQRDVVVGTQLVQGFHATVRDLAASRAYRITVQSITAVAVEAAAVVRGRTRSAALHALVVQCVSRTWLQYRLFDASVFSEKLQYLPMQTWPFCSHRPFASVEFALLDNYLVALHEGSVLLVYEYEMRTTCYAPIAQVDSVASFAVDVLTNTVYITNGSSLQRFNVVTPNAARQTLPLDSLDFESVDKVVLHSQSALLCWTSRNASAKFYISCSRLNGNGLMRVRVSELPMKLISFDSADPDSASLYWFVYNYTETRLYKADLQVVQSRIVVGNVTLLRNFTLTFPAASSQFQFANAIVRDSVLFWNDRGNVRYVDLSLQSDIYISELNVGCDGATRVFSLAEAPPSEEERARIKRQLVPQQLTKADVSVRRIDDRTVSVSWVPQNIPCTYLVRCERARDVKTESNYVVVRTSVQMPLLDCSIVASTWWLDTTLISDQFEVVRNRSLASNLTPFFYYARNASTKWTTKMRLAFAFHVPRSDEPVLRNFTVAIKACANCSESNASLTKRSVWSDDAAQVQECGNVNVSCALKLHVVSIPDKQARTANCFRLSVCSSYHCDSQPTWCTNERAIRPRWPAFIGLLDDSLAEVSALPSETELAVSQAYGTLAVRKYNLLQQQQLRIRTYCFSVSQDLLLFVAYDDRRIFATELSQSRSLSTLQATKGEVMHLACDWIGGRVFWTEVSDGQYAIYTRSFVRSTVRSGVKLVAKLEAASTVADLKFHALANLLVWTAELDKSYSLFYYNMSRAESAAQQVDVKCGGERVTLGGALCLRPATFATLLPGSAGTNLEMLLVNSATRSAFIYNLQSKQCQSQSAQTSFETCAFSGPDTYSFVNNGVLHEADLNGTSRQLGTASLRELAGNPTFEQSILPAGDCVAPTLESTRRMQAIVLTVLNTTNSSIFLQVDLSGAVTLLNRLFTNNCSRPLWTNPLVLLVEHVRVSKLRYAEPVAVGQKLCVHDGSHPFAMRKVTLQLRNLAQSSNYSLRAEVFWLHRLDAIAGATEQTRTRSGVPSKPTIEKLYVRDFDSYYVTWQSERADHTDTDLQHAVLLINNGSRRVQPVNCTVKTPSSSSCTALFSVEQSEKQLTSIALVSRNRLFATKDMDIVDDPLSSISNLTFLASTPPQIVLTDVKTREITVRWGCSRDDRYILMWVEKPNVTLSLTQLAEQMPPSNRHLLTTVCQGPVTVPIRNLKPATDYIVFGRIFIAAASAHVLWPASGVPVRTMPDVPDCASLKVSPANDAFTLGWKAPPSNGAPILRYYLKMRLSNASAAQWLDVQDVNATVSSLRLPVSRIFELLSDSKPSDQRLRVIFALTAQNAVGFNMTCHNVTEDAVHEVALPQAVLKSDHRFEVQQGSNRLALAVVVAALSVVLIVIGGCVILRRSRSLRMKAAERLHMPMLLTNDDRFIISRAQQAKLLSSNHSISSVFGVSRTPRADSNSLQSSGSDANCELSIVRLNAASKLVQLRFKPQMQTQAENLLYEPSMQALTKEALGDVSKLPRILREEIKLVKFLGSGAFGKVYEGLLTITQLYPRKKRAQSDLLSATPAAQCSSADAHQTSQIRVAIKKLRKNASNAEREEFLQEALLMMNFDHAHIVRLIGVCFEACSSVILQCDSAQVSPWPEFIVLELMNDGDLLKYLRHARPNASQPCQLDRFDLLGIIADIASGCSYLEALHFVHRDIATRNCLVHCDSNPDGSVRRVTKISDFGMARDIYRNDYYRKEGEGLLPVRWMSPEALIDGLFTTQSDVWAYGVLVWEVFTLGQQPYPARTNIEVLEYVRVGGRLDRPLNCPDALFDILSSCWDASPRQRPTFSDIHSKVTAFIEVARKNALFKRQLDFDETDLARFIATAIDTQSERFADVPDNALAAAFQKRSNTDALSKQKCDKNILDDMSSSSFLAYLRNGGYFRRKGQVIASRSRSLSLSVRPRSTNSDCSHTELLRSSDRPSITSSYVTLSSKSAALDTQTVTTSLSSSKTVLQATGV